MHIIVENQISNSVILQSSIPLFYSSSLLLAKKDLVKHVMKKFSVEKIYTFCYSLDEFVAPGVTLISRYADENHKSVDILEITKEQDGIFWGGVRTIKTLFHIYIVDIGTFSETYKEKLQEIEGKEESETPAIIYNQKSSLLMDKVVAELKEVISVSFKRRESKRCLSEPIPVSPQVSKEETEEKKEIPAPVPHPVSSSVNNSTRTKKNEKNTDVENVLLNYTSTRKAKTPSVKEQVPDSVWYNTVQPYVSTMQYD